MKKTWKLGAWVLLGLISCGFDAKDRREEQDRREQRDRELLKETYKNLEGLYTGALRDNEKVELVVLLEAVSRSDGRGESGKERFSIVLKGRAYLIGALGHYSFTGTYYEESGEIVFVGDDDRNAFSLEEGRFNAQTKEITGLIRERGGELGEVQLGRRNDIVKTPLEGWTEFELRRKKCFLDNIVGRYEGTINNHGSYLEQIEAFSMNVSYNSDGELLAMFIPRDRKGKEVQGLRLPLNGHFNPRDEFFKFESSDSQTGRTSFIDGYFRNGHRILNMNILYPAGLLGVAKGINKERVRSIEQCLSEVRCEESNRACRDQCEKSCIDRDFLLKNLF